MDVYIPGDGLMSQNVLGWTSPAIERFPEGNKPQWHLEGCVRRTIYPDSTQCTTILSSLIYPQGCIRKYILKAIGINVVKINTWWWWENMQCTLSCWHCWQCTMWTMSDNAQCVQCLTMGLNFPAFWAVGTSQRQCSGQCASKTMATLCTLQSSTTYTDHSCLNTVDLQKSFYNLKREINTGFCS